MLRRMDPFSYLQQRMGQLWQEFDREFAPLLRTLPTTTAHPIIQEPPREVASRAVEGANTPRSELISSDPGWNAMRFGSPMGFGWASAPVNLNETAEAVNVIAEVPGVPREQLQVNVSDDGILYIRGERHQERREPSDSGSGGGSGAEQYRLSERTWKRVERSVRLPPTADPNNVEAIYDNGVLKLRFAKRQPPGRIIEIK
jgi:HSP20 family molecular chaperone IbpA